MEKLGLLSNKTLNGVFLSLPGRLRYHPRMSLKYLLHSCSGLAVNIFVIALFNVPSMRSILTLPLGLYADMIFQVIHDSSAKSQTVLLSNLLCPFLAIRTGLPYCKQICSLMTLITPILLNISGLLTDSTGILDRCSTASNT